MSTKEFCINELKALESQALMIRGCIQAYQVMLSQFEASEKENIDKVSDGAGTDSTKPDEAITGSIPEAPAPTEPKQEEAGVEVGTESGASN
jgi:hypothetical protein